jgi:ZU5 domain
MKPLLYVGLACVLGLATSCSDKSSTPSDSQPTSGSTKQIGSDGGTVKEGDASVEVPKGALPSSVKISVAESDVAVDPPAGYVLAGPPIAFTPHGTTFDKPVTLTLPYSSSSEQLAVLRLDDEQDKSWEVVDGGTFSHGSGTLAVSSFSIYAVAEENAETASVGGAGGSGAGGSGDVVDTGGTGDSAGAPAVGGAPSGGDGDVRYSCDRTDNQSGLRICTDYFFPANIVKLAGGKGLPGCGPAPSDGIQVLGDACDTTDAVIGCFTTDATGIPGVTTTSWFYALEGFGGPVATPAELCSSDQQVINPP